jgi:hypothetical protein
MRPSDAWLVFLAALLLLAGSAAVHSGAERIRTAPLLEARTDLVARLGLTDLCLFTEARYTRHLSQADRFAPFQDHPQALEHFPSGSLVAPPR